MINPENNKLLIYVSVKDNLKFTLGTNIFDTKIIGEGDNKTLLLEPTDITNINLEDFKIVIRMLYNHINNFNNYKDVHISKKYEVSHDKYNNIDWFKVFFFHKDHKDEDGFYTAECAEFISNNLLFHSLSNGKVVEDLTQFDILKPETENIMNEYIKHVKYQYTYYDYFMIRILLVWDYKLPNKFYDDFFFRMLDDYRKIDEENISLQKKEQIMLKIIKNYLYTFDTTENLIKYTMMHEIRSPNKVHNKRFCKYIKKHTPNIEMVVNEYMEVNNMDNKESLRQIIIVAIDDKPCDKNNIRCFFEYGNKHVNNYKILCRISIDKSIVSNHGIKIIYNITKDLNKNMIFSVNLNKINTTSHDLINYLSFGFNQMSNKGIEKVDIISNIISFPEKINDYKMIHQAMLYCENFREINKHMCISDISEQEKQENYKQITGDNKVKFINIVKDIINNPSNNLLKYCKLEYFDILNNLSNHCKPEYDDIILLIQVALNWDCYVSKEYIPAFCSVLNKMIEKQ